MSSLIREFCCNAAPNWTRAARNGMRCTWCFNLGQIITPREHMRDVTPGSLPQVSTFVIQNCRKTLWREKNQPIEWKYHKHGQKIHPIHYRLRSITSNGTVSVTWCVTAAFPFCFSYFGKSKQHDVKGVSYSCTGEPKPWGWKHRCETITPSQWRQAWWTRTVSHTVSLLSRIRNLSSLFVTGQSSPWDWRC